MISVIPEDRGLSADVRNGNSPETGDGHLNRVQNRTNVSECPKEAAGWPALIPVGFIWYH